MGNFKSFIAGAVAMLIAVLMINTVFAATINKTVTTVYNDIKIIIDGKQIVPKDAAGKVVEPFIIDGTTYLPVRAVAEAVGYDVEWNGSTNTVILKKKPEITTTTEKPTEAKEAKPETTTQSKTELTTEPKNNPMTKIAEEEETYELNGIKYYKKFRTVPAFGAYTGAILDEILINGISYGYSYKEYTEKDINDYESLLKQAGFIESWDYTIPYEYNSHNLMIGDQNKKLVGYSHFGFPGSIAYEKDNIRIVMAKYTVFSNNNPPIDTFRIYIVENN